MWVYNVVWGHSLITIKWDWCKFFHKIEKWLIPTIKDKKVACSNSSLKLWSERKYGAGIRYCISCGKDTKRYHKS